MKDLLFGIEIEFVGLGNNLNDLCNKLHFTSNNSEFRSHGEREILFGGGNHHSYWAVKGDGSVYIYCLNPSNFGDACNDCEGCRTPRNLRPGAELVSPPLAYNHIGLSEAYRVTSALQSLGARANKTCGLHVHVDASWLRNLSQTNVNKFMNFLISSYYEDEEIFDSFVDESRRLNRNEYCRTMQNVSYGGSRQDRYYKLNTAAFLRHGTIEFRQHHGTTNPDDILNWVQICCDYYTRKRDEFLMSLDENVFTSIYEAFG